jgi:hypothetical protein
MDMPQNPGCSLLLSHCETFQPGFAAALGGLAQPFGRSASICIITVQNLIVMSKAVGCKVNGQI